jgi:ADP-heptose:LPS heptosyltransferase
MQTCDNQPDLAPAVGPEPLEETWIDPTGGLGDALMLSGVLKQVHARTPGRVFHLRRRTRYQSVLNNHPAIKTVGLPPPGARIITTDYWAREPLGPGGQRAYQVMARIFGLPTPVDELLYLPGEIAEDPFLHAYLPLDGKTICIAPSSESPRKMMRFELWENLVQSLNKMDFTVFQVGCQGEPLVKGAYSLLGLTTPAQLVLMLRKTSAVVTVDNFVMHCAHLAEKPCVVVWGPTAPEVYGYSGHSHVRVDTTKCADDKNCLGPEFPDHYGSPCPFGDRHCMDEADPNDILVAVLSAVK